MLAFSDRKLQNIPPTFFPNQLAPDTRFLGAICLLFNPESRGSVTLQSADPSVAPIIDPKFLTHEFDRRTMIEGVREMIRILSAPIYAADTIENWGPKDDSDEAIWVSQACGNARTLLRSSI